MSKAKIDVRKIVKPGCEFYEPVADTYAHTFEGRLKWITEDGKQILLQRYDFCRLFRTLTNRIASGVVIGNVEKVEFCNLFNVHSRVYNTAKLFAEAIVNGTIESQKSTLEDLEIDINRQVVEVFQSCSAQLHGRVKKLLRLYKQRNRLLKQLKKPHIHFGRRLYQDQETEGWKKAYTEARNDRLGCLGSNDETGGNSTFRLKVSELCNEQGFIWFELHHGGKLMGHFTVKPKDRLLLESILTINNQPFSYTLEVAKQGKNKGKLVRRKVTTGRVPLTIWLIRQENGHWYIKATCMRDAVKPNYIPVGVSAEDINCDSIGGAIVKMIDGAPKILLYTKEFFDPSWDKELKKAWIHQYIRKRVTLSKGHNLAVILEYLDFEGSKRWLRTKLGAMLRIMPYREIRWAFERECMKMGVVLRYVKPNYTSILGAILADYARVGRDEAAAAIIGLRGLEDGNIWLEAYCKELEHQEWVKLRINRKNKFGCTVTTDGISINRQEGEIPHVGKDSQDRKADVHWFQNRTGRGISDLSKAMGAYLYEHNHKGMRMPTCWKRSDPGGPWLPVEPSAKRSREKLVCSTLSKML